MMEEKKEKKAAEEKAKKDREKAIDVCALVLIEELYKEEKVSKTAYENIVEEINKKYD